MIKIIEYVLGHNNTKLEINKIYRKFSVWKFRKIFVITHESQKKLYIKICIVREKFIDTRLYSTDIKR